MYPEQAGGGAVEARRHVEHPSHSRGHRPEARHRAALALLAWLGSLLAGAALFHALGSGPLKAPPLQDPSSWGAWAGAREPLTPVVAVLRLVVLGLTWYLVGVTTIGLVARLTRAARLVRVADAITLPMVRRLLQGALGVGLATAMVGAASPAAPGAPAHVAGAFAGRDVAATATPRAGSADVRPVRSPAWADAVSLPRADAGDPGRGPAAEDDEAGESDEVAEDEVTLRRVDDPAETASGARPAGAPAAVPVPLELLREAGGDGAEAPPAPGDPRTAGRAHEDPGGTARTSTGEVATPPTEVTTEATGDAMDLRQLLADGDPSTGATHTVVAGESLWTIAADALGAARGEAVADAEILTYWRRLVDTNRDGLADPDNADLIFPGQVVELPPVPAEVHP
jgi:nucleoid-associated protein YgaU